MSKNRFYYIARSWFILLILLMVLIIAYFCSGCEVLKSFKHNKADTTALHKSHLQGSDSATGGSVKKENTSTKEKSDWWRMIQEYGLDTTKKQTIINNNSYPQPTRVILEGGSGTREENKSITDSIWYLNLVKLMADKTDSLSQKIDNIEKNKHSETKGLGLITLILVAAGAILLNHGIGFMRSKYNFQITKK